MSCGCRPQDSVPHCRMASRRPSWPTVTGSKTSSRASSNRSTSSDTTGGGGHVVNLVMHRPELVRSWASDVLGLFDPDYVWHDLAQVWQTAGEGEELVDTMVGRHYPGPRYPDGRVGHTDGHRNVDRRRPGASDGPGDPRVVPLGEPTGDGRGRARAGERSGSAGTFPAGHRRSIHRLRRNPPSSSRTRRRAPRCSTAWDIGGWCKTQLAAPRPSPASGKRSANEASARACKAALNGHIRAGGGRYR
jgi:hypothetical protein